MNLQAILPHGKRPYNCETPQRFFDALDARFHFTLDVCATPENAKVSRYFTEQDNALAQHWQGTCWMNPPYGQIPHWLDKARQESDTGAIVVCLLPVRTSTRWWRDYVMKAHQVIFITGRLHFNNAPRPAPFPSVIVVFAPGQHHTTFSIMERP